MKRSYRYVVHLGGPLSTQVEDLMHDLSDRFGVRAALRETPSPQLPLCGPFRTREREPITTTSREVFERYEVVPYRVDGFGHHGSETIYARAVPSPRLRALRSELQSELGDISVVKTAEDPESPDECHIPIASRDIERQFDEIWEYVTEHGEFQANAYATRVSVLEEGRLLWEWDLPRRMELDPHRASLDNSWSRTNSVLDVKAADSDHEFEEPEGPGLLSRSTARLKNFLWMK